MDKLPIFLPFGMPITSNFQELITKPKLIGNLTLDERKKKVEKYLEKKRSRKWTQIRYKIRKNLADQRQRNQGRFVKSNKPKLSFDMLNKLCA